MWSALKVDPRRITIQSVIKDLLSIIRSSPARKSAAAWKVSQPKYMVVSGMID